MYFICGLFHDNACSSDYTESNHWMIVNNELIWNGRETFLVQTRHMPGRSEENHECLPPDQQGNIKIIM
jgi:hypothetical protein